ncbi:MAG: hypothetical protein V1870_02820 [Candidatus Aenigmatarchaeota archaeon]
MKRIIKYSRNGKTEHIPTDQLMTAEQFANYQNDFYKKYFYVDTSLGRKIVNMYRKRIKAAWQKLLEEDHTIVTYLEEWYAKHEDIEEYCLHLMEEEMEKTSEISKKTFDYIDATIDKSLVEAMPKLYKAYYILHPIVQDNQELFELGFMW